jgi:hypothetical protein
VWHTVQIRQVVAAGAATTTVFGFIETINYAIASNGLHRSPAFVGVLASVQGAGAVLGGLSAATLIRRSSESRLVGIAMLLAATGAALQIPPVMASSRAMSSSALPSPGSWLASSLSSSDSRHSIYKDACMRPSTRSSPPPKLSPSPWAPGSSRSPATSHSSSPWPPLSPWPPPVYSPARRNDTLNTTRSSPHPPWMQPGMTRSDLSRSPILN